MFNKMGGFIYLICDPALNTYKIGVTRNLTLRRLKKLQTGNSTELHIVYLTYVSYPFRTETMLHNKFKDKLAHGEWYYLENDDVVNFELTCKEITDLIYTMKDNPFFNKNLK